MNTFINIPESDLRGPETEADQFAEEVRRDVEAHQGDASGQREEVYEAAAG